MKIGNTKKDFVKLCVTFTHHKSHCWFANPAAAALWPPHPRLTDSSLTAAVNIHDHANSFQKSDSGIEILKILPTPPHNVVAVLRP